ncbi:MAG: phosphatidylinositol-specific phospholipase C1-like protein [Caulobacteraceae bacterium]|nr:phosphatidylinositol-specific phospholipase C1-like protein [Caulobacteraceae bacterium]
MMWRNTLVAALGLGLAMAAGGAAQACDLAAPDAAKAGPGCARAWMDHNLRLNDLMTVGTHNSYKQAISDPIMALLKARAPDRWQALDYSHPSLTEQLNDGARALELDLVYDPQGGRFAHPAGMKLTGQAVSPDYEAAMARPGFKVMHVQDLDFRSSCPVFIDCLRAIRAWSQAHPGHAPILITMNTNDEPSLVPGGVAELPFDTAAYDALDAEIAQVFARGELITPDQVRGDYRTLREAVLKQGWPTLGQARGKILFALDEEGRHIDAYRGGRSSLQGRLLFVNTDEASPDAAYLTLNEPSDRPRIAAAVKAGFLVRTRADADTVEARANTVTRRDAALTSGAQYVSTDYPHPDPRLSSYQVRAPGGAVTVCNPQRAPERCAGLPVE